MVRLYIFTGPAESRSVRFRSYYSTSKIKFAYSRFLVYCTDAFRVNAVVAFLSPFPLASILTLETGSTALSVLSIILGIDSGFQISNRHFDLEYNLATFF